MNAGRTARERARAELTLEIKKEARRQLGASGPAGLSLRAVARELGMVSSALYRYFPSRDELLTALIVDAYDALGERAETAARELPHDGFRARWRAVCEAVRVWAVENPHEYALVYGSPVPGYQAPDATIGSAARVPAALFGIVRDAWEAGALDLPRDAAALPPPLDAQAALVADAIAPGVPRPVVLRAAVAWTQLGGMISFELFGHLARTLDPADAFFSYAVDRMADFLGLPA